MYKVGLIGTGFWSEKHLKAWQRIPNVQIAALCNRSKEKLLRKADEYGVPHDQLYSSMEEMLDRADIDIVDIVTPPETHLHLVGLAAQAGKFIMCQKPFAPSYEEAEAIVAAARKYDARLMVTENWRWLQPIQTIKQVLESGVLGNIRVARFIHSDYFTERMIPGANLPQPFLTKMPQLMFYEMGVHWYDTWRFLFGEPKRLYAELRSFSPNVIGDDSGVVTLGYDDFYGLMDICWVSRRELTGPIIEDQVDARFVEHFVVDGDRATLKMYGHEGKIVLLDNDGRETVVAERTELDHEESHYRLQSHFIDCLKSGRPFQTSGDDNLRTLRLAFATYESSEKQQVVHLG
ncbi:Gfo/Idh/MocA family protein [Paenibacillus sp. BC26]|uniref:Gfo/Idh/MocA family protein n=1 Tax=Paenibacillus sp. BC26 TaxID=1881032 RepID=UPI0008DF71DB|nr:Gfo/Idh/MocA family oxidoreductase [Paenibacillus sp. BC26]SFS56065.1 Predicted dehydrogenase [Paenibacillus sp. BC26]